MRSVTNSLQNCLRGQIALWNGTRSTTILLTIPLILGACAHTSVHSPSGSAPNKGAYYLDDGPPPNPPPNLDSVTIVPQYEPPLARANKPYTVFGYTYLPMQSYQPYQAQGQATWYGHRYHGHKTATGEIYDMYALSAAHTTLPLPSYAKVTNLDNGRTVIVRVNDRGPFKDGRLIDLSYTAAYQLRLLERGSALVSVEAIDTQEQTNTTAQTTRGNYYLQLGAFQDKSNAENLKQRVLVIEKNAQLSIISNDNDKLYRLRLGAYTNKLIAETKASELRAKFQLPISIVFVP